METKGQTKILYLDDTVYAWVQPADIGEILVASHKKHATDTLLAMGEYRLYDVRSEPHYSTHEHLELEVGDEIWQGYLLLTGLPTHAKKRRRIIPTMEVISGLERSGNVGDILTIGLQKGELS
jgi:hypothetical protein